MRQRVKKLTAWGALLMLTLFVVALAKTFFDFSSPEIDFYTVSPNVKDIRIFARDGQPLALTYQGWWNIYDKRSLHRIPELLTHAFVISEDKRFFQHNGIDWFARASALLQRVLSDKASRRGASTITEQVVRMLHPRERNIWSKWIEGLEAVALEMSVSKTEILEFYLNQVPYSSNRRGIVQAARYYFNRDVNTLNIKEMLALVVLVRAPSRFNLYNNKVKLENAIYRLAIALEKEGLLKRESIERIKEYNIELTRESKPVPAFHFVNFVREQINKLELGPKDKIRTTIDRHLQLFVISSLQNRLESLKVRNVNNAAAIIIDNQANEILAWVSLGVQCEETKNLASGCMIDMVTVPRQPASALKPFLYATALEKGWNAATVIDDAPYSDTIGKGIKHFRNYSNIYYGKVRLRSALGNSLNIPALHTINYVTPERYLHVLHDLGFQNLSRGADFYDDGLALGNGEVSLFELARAYSVFANKGILKAPNIIYGQDRCVMEDRIYSEEIISLIGNILSDPWARSLEFGRSSVLNLSTQTAVKTGTSTDYRDAWAMGYNYRYTVGVWMGNADYSATDGITGSLGPSLVLRSIFNELTKNSETNPLFFSHILEAKQICIDPESNVLLDPDCSKYTEYFIPDHSKETEKTLGQKIHILRPSKDLELAIEPRIPMNKQVFEMRLTGALATDEVEWVIDNKQQNKVIGKSFFWNISKGPHIVHAIIWRDGKLLTRTGDVPFLVK